MCSRARGHGGCSSVLSTDSSGAKLPAALWGLLCPWLMHLMAIHRSCTTWRQSTARSPRAVPDRTHFTSVLRVRFGAPRYKKGVKIQRRARFRQELRKKSLTVRAQTPGRLLAQWLVPCAWQCAGLKQLREGSPAGCSFLTPLPAVTAAGARGSFPLTRPACC